MRAALRIFLRTIKWLAVLVLALAIIVPVSLYFFFDPNDFKPQISAFLSEQSGLPLNIEGEMELSIFPWVGLKVQNISLDQAPDFGNNKFIHMDEMDLKIPLHEVLQKRLIIESLEVKGLVLNLVKTAEGQTNWESYAKTFENKPKSPESAPTTTAASSSPLKKKELKFALKNFDIKDAKVTFLDHKEKQTWVANHLSLDGAYSTKGTTPITAKFEVSLTPFKQSATLMGKGNIKGTIHFNKTTRAIDFKTDLSINMPETIWKAASLKADISGDLNSQIKIQSIDLQSGSIHATGNAALPIDSSKAITFSLALNELNLNQFKASAPKTAPTATPSAAATTPAVVSSSGRSKVRTLEGSVSINKLQYEEYTLSDVKASIRKEGSVVTLKPLTAIIFGAKLSANITHNLETAGTSTSMQGKLSDLALQPLLKALNKPEKVSGTANIDFNLAHQPSGLNGVVKCNVTQGAIEGIDIMYYLSLAQSLLKKQESTAAPDSKRTAFNSLTATLLLHDGLIDNNDLTVLGEGYKANAEGSIDLNNQTLAYKLKAFKVYSDGKEHNAYPLAIRIKGPIQNPKIEPDLDVYMKTLVNSHFDTEADKLVKKGLNKILGNDSKNDASSSDAPSSSEDIENKISKEVGKGLKKIFKVK